MKTYPLQSITIEEAMDLQFKAVDCITKEFPGHENFEPWGFGG